MAKKVQMGEKRDMAKKARMGEKLDRAKKARMGEKRDRAKKARMATFVSIHITSLGICCTVLDFVYCTSSLHERS